MKSLIVSILLLVALSSFAQQTSPAASSDAASQQDIAALRAEVAEQRKQIAEMRAMIEKLVQDKTGASPVASAQQLAANMEVAAKSTPTAPPAADAKQVATLPSLADRFRLSGDVRLRYDGIHQEFAQDRNRALLRVRLGLEGKLGEDFTGGAFLATGSLSDNPTGTNQTDSEFFTRRAIGLDRGWITYSPSKAKWMELTGGKFAYTWARTSLTFDPDLNPEGFSERFAYKPSSGPLKSISATGLQLLFNEISSPATGTYSAPDSFAAGGQVSGTLELGKRVTTTISGLALNWRNTDPIAAAMATKVLKANLNTNATVGTGASTRYLSQFMYVDVIADTTVKTASERWPLRLVFDYEKNPRARTDENNGLLTEASIGRLQKARDYQFGYSFARVEQDAVLAAFNESEFRAPTNILQHRVFIQWVLQKNTTAVVTGWFGHTLNRNLGNAAAPASLPAGVDDPYVKKLQVDLIYKF